MLFGIAAASAHQPMHSQQFQVSPLAQILSAYSINSCLMGVRICTSDPVAVASQASDQLLTLELAYVYHAKPQPITFVRLRLGGFSRDVSFCLRLFLPLVSYECQVPSQMSPKWWSRVRGSGSNSGSTSCLLLNSSSITRLLFGPATSIFRARHYDLRCPSDKPTL